MGSYGKFGKKEFEEDLPLSANQIHSLDTDVSDLLSPEEVELLLQQGNSPLTLSISKWTRIQAFLVHADSPSALIRLNDFITYESCALCLTAIEKAKTALHRLKSSEDKCRFCRLAEIDCCLKKKSIFYRIAEKINQYSIEHIPQNFVFEKDKVLLIKLTKSMLANLEKMD